MNLFTSVSVLTTAASVAIAQPHIDDGGMVHATFSYDGVGVTTHSPAETVTLQMYPGESYTGAASVLDGTAYSARFGLLHDGFFSLGAGEHMWIERLAGSAGLNAYSGGMRSMAMMHTFDPIFTADGDHIEYAGTMNHPWFSTTVMGEHSMDLLVYVGDAGGAQIDGTTSGTLTLNFNAIPSPGTAAALGLGGLLAGRRRR